MLQLVNDKFKAEMDYRTYCLEEKLQKYDEDVEKKMPKWSKGLLVQMNSQTFDAAKPITILSFLDDFMQECDTNEVHPDAAMWTFHLFMK